MSLLSPRRFPAVPAALIGVAEGIPEGKDGIMLRKVRQE